MPEAMTLFDKIWESHLVDEREDDKIGGYEEQRRQTAPWLFDKAG